MKQLTVGQRVDLLLTREKLRRAIAAWMLVCVGLMGGAFFPPPGAAWGEVKQQPPPQAFQSGDQLSVPILRDIAATLHQIDGRLSRLETVFKELTTPRPQAANGK